MGDAALMHYIVFLMDHGLAPYRDIIDPNMPTTFLIQGAVVHAFGGGSLTWRLFDFFLLVASGIAMMVICIPYDWFAGFFAAALFSLIHGRDGLIQLGQRDLTMTAFLLIGYAFLFEALRTHPSEKTKPWLTALFGICCGIAASIKPSVLLLPPTLLLMAAITLKRRGLPFLSHIVCGVVGMLAPLILVFAYLWREHVVRAFMGTVFDLIPYFLFLGRRSLGHLVVHSISSVMLPVVLIWLPVVIIKKRWLTWERAALLVGVLFGLASFYMQRKGYPYHRYPSEAFLLLLIGIDFTTILQTRSSPQQIVSRRLAITGILVGVVVVGAGSTAHALWQDWHNREFDTMLQADLNRLGGDKLATHVQCLDMADGCIPTLYNMRLMQATGFLYDCYMFSPHLGAERERYREAFWQAITRNPPTVFVVSSQDCEPYPDPPTYSYKKLSRWPLFDDYLNAHYHLDVERVPPHMVKSGSSPSKPLGYRIYLQNRPSDKARSGKLLNSPVSAPLGF